jgi:sugar lactone lactonase YvrE
VIADLVLDVAAELGEGPVWDAERRRLLFVDIMRGLVHAWDPATGNDRTIEVGEPVSAVAPTIRHDWVIATASGFSRLDPDSGHTMPIAAVEADRPETRMNHGLVDPRGRFWAGTMGMGGRTGAGTLYRLDRDGSVHPMLAPVDISNGLDWSPDGRLMYYADTPTGRVDVFDVDMDLGTIARRRTFADVSPSDGYPDGLVVDADGGVWLALWTGGAIRRYAPDGRLDLVVRVPASLTTSCAFGGEDLATLYITTAWIDLDAEGRRREPHAGGVFAVRPGARGRPVTPFGG